MKLIGADKLKEAMIRYGFHAPDMTVTEFVEDVLTPIEAEPIRRGHWIKNAEWQGWRCSECGQDDVYAFTLNWDGTADALQDYFCPYCGAKMGVEE